MAAISSGASKQKIKKAAYSQCNVRASKNAGQAFSTQRYLYIGYRLPFLFSSISPMNNKIVILMEKFSLFWYTNTALEIEQ